MQVYEFLSRHYDDFKFWSAIVGGIWMAFKGFNWFKTLKENDLAHIQMGVNDIKDKLEEQTTAVVSELRELRNDVRLAPIHVYAARSPRTKRSKSKKTKKKLI